MAVERRRELVEAVGAMDEPLRRQRGRFVRRHAVGGGPDRGRDEVERRAHQPGGWSTDTQAVERELDDRAPSAASAARRAGSNSASRSTRTPRAPHARAIAAKSTGPSSVATPIARPAPLLPHPDRPVALVVEDDDDDPAPIADRGLELGHRHRQAAVADERHDRPIAMDERRGDGRRQPVAHRAGRRAEERARPAEAEAAAGPAGEVAGVGRQDRVVGQDPPERRDVRPGMDARAVPRRRVDDRCRLPGRPVGRVVGLPGRRPARRRARPGRRSRSLAARGTPWRRPSTAMRRRPGRPGAVAAARGRRAPSGMPGAGNV